MRSEESFAGISVPPGDPGGVDGLVRSYAGVASSLRGAASRLRAAPSESPSWQGAASIAYMGLCLIAGEDADDAAGRMEQAAGAASKYRDELTEARREAREAIEEAREARERIDKAKELISDAKGRLAEARRRMASAAGTIAQAGGGAVPSGAEAELDAARRDADQAEEDLRQGERALERAEEDLERAQRRGTRADERAKDSAGLLRAALVAASPGVIGLAVGAPATASGASAAGLSGVSPGQVATFFRRIGPDGGARLVRTNPELVGPLDGAPVALRYAANRSLAEREVGRLEGELAGVDSELAEEREGGGIGFPPLVAPLPVFGARKIADALTTSREEELEAQREQLGEGLDTARPFTDPGRQLLLYDPRGDGRVAEVFGDLSRAEHATVLVPGIGNEMANFDGQQRTEAQDLHREADALSGGQAATVAWLGYDSPTGLGGGFGNPDTYQNEVAYEGGESLARTLDGINAENPGAHTTVAGHSYGSVVTGQSAAHHGLDVDDVVLTGSPGGGVGVDNVSDLSRGGEARVWSAAAPDDLIANPPTIPLPPDPPDIPGTSLDDSVRAFNEAGRAINEVHGPSPADPDFGARRFDTGPPLGEPLISTDSVGVPLALPGGLGVGTLEVPYDVDVNPLYLKDQHTTAYSDPRSKAFENLVNIATGRRDQVTAPLP